MRIALTITELDPGGAEQCLVQLAIFLSRKGHQVKVFALGETPTASLGGTIDRSSLTKLLDQNEIAWNCGPARGWTSISGTVRWLNQELMRFRPDVIQSMLFHANVVTAIANRRIAAAHFGGARVVQPNRLRRIAQRWAARRMEKLVCVSQAVADNCLQVEGIPADKLTIIPNGIDLSELDVVPINRPEELDQLLPSADTPFLIFVGRLSDQKGIGPLITRTDDLLSGLPEHHLIVLGDGPLRQRLQQQITQSRFSSRVHLLGWRPRAIDWLRESEMLILPSRYEGMPNVVLEAMSLAKPVVTFGVEGVAELLGENSPQIVHQDLPQFIARVQQLALDPNQAGSLGNQNRRRIESDFQLADQLKKYEQLYLDCFNSPRRSVSG